MIEDMTVRNLSPGDAGGCTCMLLRSLLFFDRFLATLDLEDVSP
jgi:hypothetical protein